MHLTYDIMIMQYGGRSVLEKHPTRGHDCKYNE